MPTYFVMADAYAYITADSPEEAEELAEELDSSEWDIQNFSSQEESEEARRERERIAREER